MSRPKSEVTVHFSKLWLVVRCMTPGPWVVCKGQTPGPTFVFSVPTRSFSPKRAKLQPWPFWTQMGFTSDVSPAAHGGYEKNGGRSDHLKCDDWDPNGWHQRVELWPSRSIFKSGYKSYTSIETFRNRGKILWNKNCEEIRNNDPASDLGRSWTSLTNLKGSRRKVRPRNLREWDNLAVTNSGFQDYEILWDST